MFVLQTTWQIKGHIEKEQRTFEKYEELVSRISHWEPLLIGNERFIGEKDIRLLNVEIFYSFADSVCIDPNI